MQFRLMFHMLGACVLRAFETVRADVAKPEGRRGVVRAWWSPARGVRLLDSQQPDGHLHDARQATIARGASRLSSGTSTYS